jgi:hypothetical protein
VEGGFTSEARAAHAWGLYTHPLYGPHTFSYYHGTRAVEAGYRGAVAEGEERAFLDLLYSRPQTLEASAAGWRASADGPSLPHCPGWAVGQGFTGPTLGQLTQVLEAMTAGKEPPVDFAPTMGCSIKWAG